MGKILYWLSVIRSYIFCFRYMPREIAIHCPILIYWNTKFFISSKARIIISEKVKKHDIMIGVWGGSYGLRQGKTRFCVFDDSMVVFNGKTCISKGSNVVVRQGASLNFGDNFFCNANCNILANRGISFGDNVLMGWNITILDNDGHPTYWKGEAQETSQPIHIGEHCWIGSHATILKGVYLATGTIIPYGCTIYKSNNIPNNVFNNKSLKTEMMWKDH